MDSVITEYLTREYLAMNESDIERAEHHQQFLLQQRIDQQRKRVPKGLGVDVCECGNNIPVGRKDLGYDTCIQCARTQERKDALYRR